MAKGIQGIVQRQVARWNVEKKVQLGLTMGTAPRPVITVSRKLGSGGRDLAQRVATRLGCELVDRKIIDEIVRRSEARGELVEAMDERTRSQIRGWIEGILRGEEFDEGDYYRLLLEVVRSFAQLGSVVLLGRGAHFVPLDRPVLRVQVVAPMEHRTERIMTRRTLTREDAAAACKASDAERRRFVRRLFAADWDDPLAFDLVINTGRMSLGTAAAAVEQAWLHHLAHAKDARPR